MSATLDAPQAAAVKKKASGSSFYLAMRLRSGLEHCGLTSLPPSLSPHTDVVGRRHDSVRL